MPEYSEEEVGKAVEKMGKICDRLYSSDGHTGDIPEIKGQMTILNGSVQELRNTNREHENRLNLIDERQRNIFPRFVMSMPRWGQVVLGLAVLGAISNLGLAVDQILSIFLGGD